MKKKILNLFLSLLLLSFEFLTLLLMINNSENNPVIIVYLSIFILLILIMPFSVILVIESIKDIMIDKQK